MKNQTKSFFFLQTLWYFEVGENPFLKYLTELLKAIHVFGEYQDKSWPNSLKFI